MRVLLLTAFQPVMFDVRLDILIYNSGHCGSSLCLFANSWLQDIVSLGIVVSACEKGAQWQLALHLLKHRPIAASFCREKGRISWEFGGRCSMLKAAYDSAVFTRCFSPKQTIARTYEPMRQRHGDGETFRHNALSLFWTQVF